MNDALSLLGLCRKAGMLASGSFAAEKAVKERKAKLVIVAEDASENTKKLFRDKGSHRSIRVIEYGTKEAIGKAVGADERACAAVLDSGFAEAILKRIKMEVGI